MCKINYVTANAVALAGLMCGAAIVHNVYKPDLVRCLPRYDASTFTASAHLSSLVLRRGGEARGREWGFQCPAT